LRRLLGFFRCLGEQVLIALVARLGLGLARARARGDPLLLAREGALVLLLLASLLLEALLLLRQPRRIIAFVRNAAPAIELENPSGHIVEEVAVVGDDQDRAWIVARVSLEPRRGLGIEVVGRLVEQQQLG